MWQLRRRLVVIVLASVLLVALAATAWGVATARGYCPVTGIETPASSEPSSDGT